MQPCERENHAFKKVLLYSKIHFSCCAALFENLVNKRRVLVESCLSQSEVRKLINQESYGIISKLFCKKKQVSFVKE